MKLSLEFMKFKNFKRILLFLAVFFLAVFARFWHMEYFPFQGDADELAYVFAGSSLLKLGKPVSWSNFHENYGENRIYKKKIIIKDERFNLHDEYLFVYPWFDHPPILSLIEGIWTKFLGYSFPAIFPSLVIRIPTLIFSSITLILIFAITKKLFGFYCGLFSLIFIGFSPSLIFIHRMVVGETVYIPIILFTVYMAITKNDHLLPLILISGLTPLAKITGLLVIPIISFYLLLQKKYKKTIFYILGSLFIFAYIYCLYGYIFDWEAFVILFKTQSFRLLGWSNPAFILSHPGFHIKTMLDASYYLILILGLVPLFCRPSRGKTDRRKYKFLLFSIFSSFLLVWATSSEQDMLGWYKLPLFTFLTISAGAVVKKDISLALLLLLAMTVISNFGIIRTPAHPYPLPLLLRTILAIVFGSIFLLAFLKTKKIQAIKRFILIILLLVYIGSSFYIVDKYYETLCDNVQCPIPVLTSAQIFRNFIGKIR